MSSVYVEGLVNNDFSHNGDPRGRPNHPTSLLSSSMRYLKIRGGASKPSKKISSGRSSSKQRKKGGSRTGSLTSTSSKSEKAKAKTGADRTLSGKPSLRNASKQSKSAANDILQRYSKVLPLTRIYMTICSTLTILSLLLGEELSQGLFALTPSTFPFQPWRVLTAGSFLGPPSISSLMSVYYLYEYGSNLERTFGTSTFLLFVTVQMGLLAVLAKLFMTPFFANSVITAMLHVLSRQEPFQKVKWLVFTVPYWTLPFGLMASDVLQQQSGAAALPHVMGIITGHFYHFHTKIWPRLGGSEWLVPPDWVRGTLDEDGVLKGTERKIKRKRGKGVKLGSV